MHFGHQADFSSENPAFYFEYEDASTANHRQLPWTIACFSLFTTLSQFFLMYLVSPHPPTHLAFCVRPSPAPARRPLPASPAPPPGHSCLCTASALLPFPHSCSGPPVACYNLPKIVRLMFLLRFYLPNKALRIVRPSANSFAAAVQCMCLMFWHYPRIIGTYTLHTKSRATGNIVSAMASSRLYLF